MDKKITPQSAFNIVWKYFVVETHPQSLNSSNQILGRRCVYNGENGTHCAFAILLPQKVRVILDEGKTARYNILHYEEITRYFEYSDGDFYDQLQLCHDQSGNIDFTSDIRKRLKVLANDYRLTVPEETT